MILFGKTLNWQTLNWQTLNWQRLKKLSAEVKIASSQCLLCHGSCNKISMLCDYCDNDLAIINQSITKTTAPLNLLSQPNVARSINHQYFEQLWCLAIYQWPISRWLSQMKFHGKFEFAKLISTLVAKNINTQTYQNYTLVSVPMHIKRWQERGFNQSHLLAEKIALQLHLPYQHNLINRVVHTEHQIGKSGVARRKNLKNAFQINTQETLPQYIILFDDVITTGTTVNQISKLLKAHGVQEVVVLTIAIALQE